MIVLPESGELHSPANRKFTGIPSMAISKGGRIWASWYAGITPKEDNNNYVVVAASDDGGESWNEKVIINPDAEGPVRAFDPELWIDPTGKLWVFWAQAIGHDGTIAGVWTLTVDEPDAAETAYSEPIRLTDGVMMCKPTVLSSGDWVLPASTWKLTANSARVVVSTDQGASWQLRGAVDVPEKHREFDEHMIIEKKDGSLRMLVRTRYGIGESKSNDMGSTWSALRKSDIKHPSARFFIRRLESGNLLLVKHGPIDEKTQRSHLMAFISKNEGKSWSKGLLIDQRLGVSYPDGQQTADGRIYIIYDYDRTGSQNICLTSFTEEDVLARDYDKRLVRVFNNRKIVSKGGQK